MSPPSPQAKSTRLVAAAVICVVSLGLGWQSSRASTGYLNPGLLLPTTQISPVTGDLSTSSIYYPGAWVAGNPMRPRRGFQADVRVVLVGAAVVFALGTRSRSERMRRALIVSVLALMALAALALSRGMQAAAISMLAAVALTGPLVLVSPDPGWRRSLAWRSTG